jgi:hypothetical protein
VKQSSWSNHPTVVERTSLRAIPLNICGIGLLVLLPAYGEFGPVGAGHTGGANGPGVYNL